MNEPLIPHKRKDPKTGGEIWVMSDRKLTNAEVQLFINAYFLNGGKRPRLGTRIQIEVNPSED